MSADRVYALTNISLITLSGSRAFAAVAEYLSPERGDHGETVRLRELL